MLDCILAEVRSVFMICSVELFVFSVMYTEQLNQCNSS